MGDRERERETEGEGMRCIKGPQGGTDPRLLQ